MVIGHFLIVDDTACIHPDSNALGTGHILCGQIYQHRQRIHHIGSQIAAVCAGIGTQLFLIQTLYIVQRLLCRVSQQPVCFSLKGSQVIQRRGLFAFFLSLHALNNSGVISASLLQLVSGSGVAETLTHSSEVRKGQHYIIERLWLERRNLCFSLDNQGQRRGHDTTNVQSTAIEDRKKPGGIDANQPVSLISA